MTGNQLKRELKSISCIIPSKEPRRIFDSFRTYWIEFVLVQGLQAPGSQTRRHTWILFARLISGLRSCLSTPYMMIPYILLKRLQVLQRSNFETWMSRRTRFILSECNMDLLTSWLSDIEPTHFNHEQAYFYFTIFSITPMWLTKRSCRLVNVGLELVSDQEYLRKTRLHRPACPLARVN